MLSASFRWFSSDCFSVKCFLFCQEVFQQRPSLWLSFFLSACLCLSLPLSVCLSVSLSLSFIRRRYIKRLLVNLPPVIQNAVVISRSFLSIVWLEGSKVVSTLLIFAIHRLPRYRPLLTL